MEEEEEEEDEEEEEEEEEEAGWSCFSRQAGSPTQALEEILAFSGQPDTGEASA